ncbi:hypothetical protein [Glycomyces paridis]|uniref:Uncharacterized protein n=1 Tax=Glycomyces paridis TaxID=2126555 RepID=A0A4S8PVF3_9ACTN|nr:hypothetical protein [Glycomyces paridis]THV32189.1 hypothetical protein E9998_01730 [Glycomyces paridis]
MTISGTETLLDGLSIGHLPDRLGTASDFEFEWGEVKFVQRVWETEIEPGSWRVDLQVQVLRSDALADLVSLRAFLAEYHERDVDWATEPFGQDGFKTEREAARLLAPGLAVEVRDPFGRQGPGQIDAVAAAVHRVER